SAEADSLVRLLVVAAAEAGYTEPASAPAEPTSVDKPVAIISQPPLSFQGTYGRVVVEYVVGSNGRVEPDSIDILLASASELVPLARNLLLGSRFEPATINGKPVRQLARQVFTWRFK